MFGHAQHSGHQRSHKVRDLGGGVQSVSDLSPVFHSSNDAARFHGSRDKALADDSLLHDNIGFGKSLVDVAAFLVVT